MNAQVLDIDKLRSETPGCSHVTHFNNAGAALMPRVTSETITEHIQLETKIGGYEALDAASERLDAVYTSVASLLNAKPNEIAIIENATRAWDMAFHGIDFEPGDVIHCASAAYASNYIAYLLVAQRQGIEIDIVPNDEHGQLDVDALDRRITNRSKLISLVHVPTNCGLVNPAVEVGRVAKKHDLLYLLDACQSVGQMPIDVRDIGCDMLSSTARKYLRGPRGVGFLYVRQGLINQLEPPLLDLHAATWTGKDDYKVREDAKRFENWEHYVAGKLGLGAAVDYLLQLGVENTWPRVQSLASQLREKLSSISSVTVVDIGQQQCGICSFTVDGKDANVIAHALREQKINVSVSRAEYSLIDMQARGLTEIIRASVHYYNTEEELDTLCQAIERLS